MAPLIWSALLVALSQVPGARAQITLVWNIGNGSWNSPTSWLPASLPGSSDTAQIGGSAGNITVDSNTSVGRLQLSGGNLGGTATLTLTASGSTWNGGAMNSTGALVIASGASLSLGNGANHDFNQHTITNQGTVTWTSGYIRGGNGSVFTNASGGTFNDLNSSGYSVHNPAFNGTFGSFVFENNGTYNRTVGASTQFDTTFNNSGTVNVSGGGRITLNGGGTSSGAFNVSGSNSDLLITSNYALTNGASLNGAVRITGGALTASGTIAVNGASFEGGSLQGSQTFSGGTLAWIGGDWNAAATTTIAAGATLTMGNGANHDFNRRTIVNNGTTTWSSGYIRGGNGSAFTNASGATFNDFQTSGYSIQNPAFEGTYGSFVFTNNGTYVRNGSNPTYLDVVFNNNGLLNLQAGEMRLRGGGTMSASGTISVASGASLYFDGDYTIADGVSLSGMGAFNLVAGILTVPGTISISTLSQYGGRLDGTNVLNGIINWYGGDWNSAVAGQTTTIGSTGTLNLGNGANHDFNRRRIINTGVTNWSNGYIRGGNGSSFVNATGATFNDLQTAGYSIHNPAFDGTYGTFTFTNNGTYVRNGGNVTYFDAPFDNNGTITVQAGDVRFRAGGVMSASGTIAAATGTNVFFDSDYTIANGVSLTGAGAYNLVAGVLTLPGTLTISTLNQSGGRLAGTNVLNGIINWNGGDWNTGAAGATTTIGSSATLNLGNGAYHDFNQRGIVNNGITNWGSGYIRGGNGSSFTNSSGGTFNDLQTSGYSIHNPAFDGTYGAFTFTNNGTYLRNGANTTYLDVPFNNNGAVIVQAGDLRFRAGGTLSASGTISAASGTNISFDTDYTIANGASLTGAGAYHLNSGTLTLTGLINIGTFNQWGGSLGGTGSINGTFNWNGGDWNAAALGPTTTIASAGILNLGNGAYHDFNQRAVTNSGTVNWVNGYIRGGNGSTFTNASGGTFNDLNSSGYSVHNPAFNGTYGSFTFTNNGTYVRSVGGTTYFDTTFNNNGTINLQQGEIQLRAGGTMSATSVVNASAGASLLFTTSYTLLDGAKFTGLGAVTQYGGTLTLDGTLAASAFNWYGGDWNVTGSGHTTTIGAATKLILGNGAYHDFNRRAIVNAGTINWNDGYIRGGNGSTFLNASGATFNDFNSSGYTVHNPGFEGTYGTFTFTNNGSYVRNAANTTYFDTTFVNNASVQLQQGTLELRAGGTMSSTSVVNAVAGTTLFFRADYTLLDGAKFTGAGNFIQTGGTLTLNGTLAAPTFYWHGGDWNASATGLTTTIGAGTLLVLGNGAQHDFNQRAIVNNGTVAWNDGYIRGGNGSSFTNASGATFNDLNGSGYTVHNPGFNGTAGTFVFTNNGNYVRNAGGTTYFDTTFNNNGTLNLQQGDIQIRAGGTMSATSVVNTATGTNFYLTNDYTLQSGSRFTGTGAVQQTGGTLTVDLLKASAFHWIGGNWNGAGTSTIDTGTVLNLSSGNNKDFNARTLVNNGTVNWNAGYLRSGNGGSFTNAAGGVFNDVNASGYTVHNPFGGSFTFANNGVYNRATTGTTFFDVPFTNSGTINLTGGSLNFRSTYTNNNGALNISNGATAQFSGALALGTGALTGTGTISAPSVTAGGVVSPGNSPGALGVTGNLTLLATSTLIVELGGTTQGTSYDFLSVGGAATLAGNLNVKFVNGFQSSATSAQTFTVLTASSALAGAFTNVASGQRIFTSDGFASFRVDYGIGSTSPNSVVLSSFLAVPEPSTWALLGLGGIVVLVLGRRRNRLTQRSRRAQS